MAGVKSLCHINFPIEAPKIDVLDLDAIIIVLGVFKCFSNFQIERLS